MARPRAGPACIVSKSIDEPPGEQSGSLASWLSLISTYTNYVSSDSFGCGGRSAREERRENLQLVYSIQCKPQSTGAGNWKIIQRENASTVLVG